MENSINKVYLNQSCIPRMKNLVNDVLIFTADFII